MTTIELSENSITVLNKLELDSNHILCINVDTGNLPYSKAQEFCLEVAKTFQNKLNCEVVVSPKNVEFTVVKKS